MTRKSAVERITYRKQHAVDPEEFLLDVGAVEPSEDARGLSLTETFQTLIEDHLETVRADPDEIGGLANIFGVDEDDVTKKDREYTAFKIIYTVRKWPSEGALLVDLATDLAFRDLTDRWEEVPPRQRYRLLQSLQSFRDECLLCGGSLTLTNEVVQSCCSERGVITLYCEDCDRRFLEFTANPNETPHALLTQREE